MDVKFYGPGCIRPHHPHCRKHTFGPCRACDKLHERDALSKVSTPDTPLHDAQIVRLSSSKVRTRCLK